MISKAKKHPSKIKKCLILNWSDLPKEHKKTVADHPFFHNDCYLEYHSELDIKDFKRGLDAIGEYCVDQKNIGNYDEGKSISEFIQDYGLSMDVWIMENIEIGDAELILIKVSW